MVKSNGFQYYRSGRSTEDVTRRSKQTSGLYDSVILDGFSMFKVREGENIIRIMPPTWLSFDAKGNVIEDDMYQRWGANWEIQIYIHNNIGPDRGSFLCLDKMRGEPCPICEIRRESTDDDERYELAPNLRALAWQIDRQDEKAGPQLWAMPIKKVFRVINARSIDKKGGGIIWIDDPEDGFDVSFMCDGAGKKTADYSGVEVMRDPTHLHDDQRIQDKWLDYIVDHPLPSVLNFQDSEYIEKVLMGRTSKRAEAAEAQPELPPRRTSRPAQPEETAEAPPTRARRAAAPAPVPEEGIEVEEVEGEVPPRRRARAAAAEPPQEEEPPFEAETNIPRRGRPQPQEAEEAAQAAAPPRRAARPAAEAEAEAPPPRRTARRPAAEPAEELPEQSQAARRGLERLRPGAR